MPNSAYNCFGKDFPLLVEVDQIKPNFILEAIGVDPNKTQLTESERLKLTQYETAHKKELQEIVSKARQNDSDEIIDNQINSSNENNPSDIEDLEQDAGKSAEGAIILREMEDRQEKRKAELDIATFTVVPWYVKAVTPTLAVLCVIFTFVAFAIMIRMSGEPFDQKTTIQTVDSLYAQLQKINISSEKIPELLQVALRNVETESTGARATQKEIMLYILGMLSAIASQIFSYYFGSSTGSVRKDETLGTLLKRKSYDSEAT